MTGKRQQPTACSPGLGESQKPSSAELHATHSPTSDARSNGAAFASLQSSGYSTQQTMPDALPDEAVEFITKAAIREYDGGLDRVRAESAALQEISRMYGTAAAKKCDEWRRANP